MGRRTVADRIHDAPALLGRLRAVLATALPRGALILSILTFGGYAMGLLRDRLFARTFGAGPELDAYNAAFVLPELVLDVLVASGLVAPFVPLFVGLKGEAEEAARAFGRVILTLAVGVMAVAAALLFVFAPESVALIAPGFVGPQRELYIGLFRVMCVTPVIFAASIVIGEVLVAERRFVTYGLAPLFYNGGIVAGTLLLADRIGIYGAAVGAVAGAVAHLAVRLVGIRRTTFRPRPSFAFRTRGLGEFLRLMAPKMASHPIEPLTFLYFTSLASTLVPGAVSSVSFARNFQSVPVSLIGASFAIAAFPALSAAAAAGDRRGFTRVFGTNLVTIAALTTGAMLGLLLLGGMAIRILLGGGAFDDEDVVLTTGVLAVFAISIPLESLTHLLSRALYATRNTLLQTLASVCGFVATVAAAETLAPRIGLAAVPAAFAVGMAVKVGVLAVVLAPRIARIGATSRVHSLPAGSRVRPVRTPLRPRLVRAVLGVLLVALAIGTLQAIGTALSGASLAVAPVVTPWAREPAPATTQVVASPAATGSASPTPPTSSGPSASLLPAPTPTFGPFAMDLYQQGDFIGQYRNDWCVPASLQTAMNIMDVDADGTRATQARLFDLTRSLAPAPDGSAEPEGWAMALTELSYGRYEVSVEPSLQAAVQVAARQIRLTNRPAALLVWRGAHVWVMSGFEATADPAVTNRFTVTAARIQDVWYNRFSTLWGYSRPANSLVPVEALPEDFLPWKRPRGSYPDKDGKFVIVIPTNENRGPAT